MRRQPGQRRADATVTRRFSCPACGEPHAAAEHGVLACHELSGAELQRFDRIMLEEIGLAAIAGEFGEVRQLAAVLAGIRARLARETDAPVAVHIALARRARIADERRPTLYTR